MRLYLRLMRDAILGRDVMRDAILGRDVMRDVILGRDVMRDAILGRDVMRDAIPALQSKNAVSTLYLLYVHTAFLLWRADPGRSQARGHRGQICSVT